ncbi:E3 SUMO-protein ligase SIZ1 [Acorus calamus]|uniref:E3 SUMO-protein ligase SIZ1 n=1 Tax=Acorus calamus TaxID=4465 RepID=A0AAV9F2W0_ACOCL|nr:E3 SUMO-protein ligase SIZ1 [Acorus calamus]
MDLVSSCKDKVAYFRIRELKDILTQLGLPKQGKKQDLVERISALLSDEQASRVPSWGRKNSIGKEGIAKIIDDTYRKMQDHGAVDLASKGHTVPNPNNTKIKEETIDPRQFEMKVRCPCGSSLFTDSMIQCDESRCRIWQHISCVIIPEKPIEGVLPEVPSQFYCEVCRLNKADPFWHPVGHPMLPVKLPASIIAADGANTVQTFEKTFQLTRADKDMLQRTEFDLQVWCILLNDKVSFRMQWPQYAELNVNGIQIRTTNRPGSQLLGTNGRDDGPVITTYSREGINKISLTRVDARIFCLGVRIVKRRTLQQVLNMIPKESDGESFEDALARVRRCLGGGATAENADSDSDLEVVADSVTVNLRCPNSGSRIRIAGRFKPCVHMGCFDLETFVELNQRSRKWQCPICLKNYSLEKIIIDPYFNRITSKLCNCGEDVNEVDVKPDGSWRAKNETDCRDLAQWHLPDGSLCVVTKKEVKSEPSILNHIKQEVVSDGHAGLKLEIKKNRNGIWEVSKPEDTTPPSSRNRLLEKTDNHRQKVVAMSSSATGSCRDGEDTSVNQEGGGLLDLYGNNGNELDSLALKFDMTYNFDRIPPPPSRDADVIVLSDSEEDNVTLVPPEIVYGSGVPDGDVNPYAHPVLSESYPEDPGIGTSGNSCLGLFNNNEDFSMSLWPLPSGPNAGSGFQFFGTNGDVPDALIDEQAQVAGYGLGPLGDTTHASHVHDLSTCNLNSDINGTLVDNPMIFGGDDPSLQIFLPPQPAAASAQEDVGGHAGRSNGIRKDDWISLRLGAGSGHGESASKNNLNARHQFSSDESKMDTLANTASLLMSMNDDRTNKATPNRERSDSPFTHPRQPRSVRPRLYLSIDSDSE